MDQMMPHVVPYMILVLNTAWFTFMRKVCLKISPKVTRPLVAEAISTLELCADCAELGVVWEVHGNIGYGSALMICCVWWSYHWDDAEACPCGPVEDCFLLGTPVSSWPIMSRLLGQFLGAFVTWGYVQSFWSLHMIPQHEALNTQECVAGLQVPILYAAIVEAVITFVSRLVALESGYWPMKISALINAITTVALCILALDSSGGFFNPILASALTLNCSGNNLIQHLFVYWMGSLTGGIVARTLHMMIRGFPAKDKLD